MEQVRAEMEAGTDPSDERVQVLATRWMGLVEEFTGGDPGIERSLGNLWQQEENIHGIDTGEVREVGEYVFRTLASRAPKTKLASGGFSPPATTRTRVVAALPIFKRRSAFLTPSMLLGVLGYATCNYLGVGTAYLIRSFTG